MHFKNGFTLAKVLFPYFKDNKIAFTLAEVFLRHSVGYRKAAFTLAEVLITLGIIGVVAAMTLPTIIKKYEKRVIEVQLQKTYSDLENMIRRAEVDNGSYEYWDFTDRNWYNKYFQPYLHATPCKGTNMANNYCFLQYGGDLRVFRYANGDLVNAGDAHWAAAPKYMLDDGRAILIEPVFDASFDRNWKYTYFVVDVNGKNGPCIMGRDVFSFVLFNYKHGHTNKGLKIGGIGDGTGDYSRTSEDINANCVRDGGYACGLLIQRNNWKIPNDYPIKF